MTDSALDRGQSRGSIVLSSAVGASVGNDTLDYEHCSRLPMSLTVDVGLPGSARGAEERIPNPYLRCSLSGAWSLRTCSGFPDGIATATARPSLTANHASLKQTFVWLLLFLEGRPLETRSPKTKQKQRCPSRRGTWTRRPPRPQSSRCASVPTTVCRSPSSP